MYIASKLYNGEWIFIETTVPSWTGNFLYSDCCDSVDDFGPKTYHTTTLNNLALIPIIGIASGLARVALAIIHITIHLFLAAISGQKGHLYHAAKGGIEIGIGAVEMIPFIGRYVAWTTYSTPPSPDDHTPSASLHFSGRIRVHNPQKIDQFDQTIRYINQPTMLLTGDPDEAPKPQQKIYIVRT